MFAEKPFICFFGDSVRRYIDEVQNPSLPIRLALDVYPIRNAVRVYGLPDGNKR